MEESPASIGLISRRNSAVSKARDVRTVEREYRHNGSMLPALPTYLTSCYRAPAGTLRVLVPFKALADETINREWAGARQ